MFWRNVAHAHPGQVKAADIPDTRVICTAGVVVSEDDLTLKLSWDRAVEKDQWQYAIAIPKTLILKSEFFEVEEVAAVGV
ncbi:hypothetical protein H6G00_06495 [Leptolyngbya sp. FACHB-541]|uniref:hypothetical protein n=1 Tax=Leptolyngbya sp. FACHB-541 TaxID=2692810 RepID=UPI001687C51E|nr:hypothetical protein [Leptolyngbya sp. FACHB-541]MBD1996266.1 hypothetical protein [Leptolyngbya sp. FACHB-541]